MNLSALPVVLAGCGGMSGTLLKPAGTENFHGLAMVFAAIESAREGQRVTVAAE